MAEQDPGPVVQRITLGCELRALREAAKISTDDAATALRWYRSKVSKVETGTVRVTAAELSDLLSLYEADRHENRPAGYRDDAPARRRGRLRYRTPTRFTAVDQSLMPRCPAQRAV